jgi:hypothetical protein
VLADRISDLSQEFEAASHIKARNSTGLRHHTFLTGTSIWNYGTCWFRTSLRGMPCRPLGTNLQLPGRCENALLIWDSPIRRATLRRPRRIGR